MKKLLLLLFTCLSLSFSSNAQIGSAQKNIKLGNTLREAKQFDEAQKYLERALKSAQVLKDRYWQAAAYENLAFVNRDRNDFQNATYYFSKAIELFSVVNSQASVKALQQMLDGIKDKNEIYAGIEIGAKGVKFSIIGVRFTADGKLSFKIIKSDDINASAQSCTPASFQDAAKAVHTFLDTLAARNIPKDHIFVAGSSGLRQELDRCGKREELLTVVRAEVSGIYPNPIDFIEPCTEAELVTRGTVPSRYWGTTAMIDIGSGNTKGGYYSNGQFECIDYYGTGAFTKYVQDRAKGRPFAEATASVYNDDVKQLIGSEMGRKPGFQTREQINFSGGIIYALTTYLYPEKILDKEVTFTYKDAQLFKKLAVEDYAKLTNPDLTRIDGDETYKKAQSEIKKVKEKVFTQEQIIAGATLVEGIMDEIRKNTAPKKYVFQREGIIGWISGYIVKAIAKGYQDTKEL